MDDKFTIWDEVKQTLAGQMIATVYNQHIKPAQLVENCAGFTLAVRPTSKPWLEQQRMRSLILSTIEQTIGGPTQLHIITHDDLSHQDRPPDPAPIYDEPALYPEPDTTPSAFDPLQVDWRGIRNKAYTPVAHYATSYWQAYLARRQSRSYGLWIALQNNDIRNTMAKDFTDWWTPVEIHRIRQLAAMVGAGYNTNALVGRRAPCRECLDAIDIGQPLKRCCGAKRPAAWYERPDDDAPLCKYWQPGAFEVLQEENLIAVEVDNGTTNSHELKTQCWRLLPVLTPHQARTLPESLQIDHDKWIDHYGHYYGLDRSTWSQITAHSLVPLMPGWEQGRKLGTHVWNRIIRDIADGVCMHMHATPESLHAYAVNSR